MTLVDDSNMLLFASKEVKRRRIMAEASTAAAVLREYRPTDGTVKLPFHRNPHATIPYLILKHPDKQFLVDWDGIRYVRTKP